MLFRKFIVSFFVCFSLFIILPAQSAPVFTSPLMVNEMANSNVDTDGSRTIAVFDENVYAIWIDWDNNNIQFAKSNDRGQTFTNPVYPSSIIDTTKAQLFPAISVDEYGTIFILWTMISDTFTVNSGMYLTRSTDGGESFEEARNVVTMPSVYCSMATYEDNVYLFYPSMDNYPFGEYYFQRSTDNGDNFSDPIQVTDVACADSLKFDSMTDMIVDKDGIIHMVWNDARRSEGNSDIYYCNSTDGGQSFSTNIPVNDLNSSIANIEHWDPSIAVMQNGDIYVTWRYHIDFQNNQDWDYRNQMAVKYHDSDSFTNHSSINASALHSCGPAIAINKYDQMYIIFSARDTKQFCYSLYPGDENFTMQEIGKDNSSHGATSYPSIVIDNENKACILWTDNTDIYFSRGGYDNPIKIDDSMISAETFALYQNYPNPFNPRTTISYEIKTDAFVELSVFNINGNWIETLVRGEQNPGSYSVDFNHPELPSGLYYYQLKSGEDVITKKMMLLK